MHYAKIHFGDYARDTGHLTLLEHGIYLQLMRLYYTTERPLTADLDRLCRAISARSEDERKAVSAVLEDFFTQDGDGWHQKRIDAEIAKFQDRSATNSEIGKLGGRPKKPTENPQESETVSNGNPQITLTTNHKPLTNTKPLCAVSTAPGGFQAFWKAWPKSPRRVGKAACLKKWVGLGLETNASEIIAAVEALKNTKQWRGGFEPAPLTFINQRRWEDGPVESQTEEKRFVV